MRKDVPVVIFAGNFPKRQDVKALKDAGKKTMAFASTMSIANQMVRFGIDALMLEGSEAGGHIGHVSLTILLQQVLFEDPGVPVFVAGGIATGKMIAHMLLMGAAGCQLGTRFVLSEECTAHEELKKTFIKARAREAVETPQYDKRIPVVAVRALKNRSMEEFGRLQLMLLDQLNQGNISREQAQLKVEEFWMGGLRQAVVEGDVRDGSLMAGQSVGLVSKIQPMSAIFEELITDAEAELTKTAVLLSDCGKTGKKHL
jgi:enoyl-[acyl-carrier protein] reductase II